ncbi:RNA-directed DNA polymerase [Striga asiatica]|uniref:RNA-directed DNA polymerase n=1 Tax=Striga asiatica TaxID=4170 RepID=A0A5A7Q9N9_STRAF|nr:RNA-directed DNA polymerase [Striga asiatica]
MEMEDLRGMKPGPAQIIVEEVDKDKRQSHKAKGWRRITGKDAKIRDGISTNIFSDPWIPNHHSGKPQLKRGVSSNLKTVNQLKTVGRDSWDRELLQELFIEEDVKAILEINSLNQSMKDRVMEVRVQLEVPAWLLLPATSIK